MDLTTAGLTGVASAVAAAMNAVVGAGSVVLFPTVVALGYPPLVANVSNTIGLSPGALASAWSYRDRIRHVGRPAWVLLGFSMVGGIVGGLLLLSLPSAVFNIVVPLLLAAASVLAFLNPWVKRHLEQRRGGQPLGRPRVTPLVAGLVLATGVYGGYFGAAQGVIGLAVLGTWFTHDMQDANAVKNLLAAGANSIAGLLFAFSGHVDWQLAGVVAVGALIGATFGSRVARLIPDDVLRTALVVLGITAAIWFWVRG